MSASGTVTGVALGQALVRATSEGVQSGAATVTVTPFTFGNGTRLVGSQIPVGRYRSLTSQAGSCYWERLNGASSIIANDLGSGPRLVDIVQTDHSFSSNGCAAWIGVVGGVRPDPGAPVPNGVYLVPAEVTPGLYRSLTGSGSSCYWERMAGFEGTLDQVLANDIGSGVRLVAIAATDVGFQSSNCATWARVTGGLRPDPSAPLGEGFFLVPSEVAVGTWQSTGAGNSCYWERLSGFSGASSAVIANGIGAEPQLVVIQAGDAGFSSSRCGAWVKLP